MSQKEEKLIEVLSDIKDLLSHNKKTKVEKKKNNVGRPKMTPEQRLENKAKREEAKTKGENVRHLGRPRKSISEEVQRCAEKWGIDGQELVQFVTQCLVKKSQKDPPKQEQKAE
jgi:hypothetical protein